ncbi:hypothetical protein B0I31_109228 [Saccharothrix carnea]|uniref:Uncharacterized protein n=1 Tax=Saccharothrix carnea TaxID=1280637 RepID=A0A2P8I4Q1_SACCR|nr:hypothetical protein [Saccharothrix carnea]PSL53438.1 hypothetical protein B0I31_109228 [Saccharothrix carnea]
MKGLRELLVDAVPDLPEVDRVAEVGRRVRRRRRTRGVVAAGVVVALTAGALVGTQWFGSVREESPVATAPPPIAVTPVLDCPPEPGHHVGWRGPDGPVAHESAVNALACVYGGGEGAYFRVEIGHDVANVVRAMNALAAEDEPYPGDYPRACTLIGWAQYVIVVGYPDGTRHDVGIDLNCGTLFRDDLVRYGDITRPLDEFAAIVRADGREFPYPHVDRW